MNVATEQTMPAAVLLVTGASRGIGAETAVLAASRGYRVCVNYTSAAAAAQAVVERIRQAGGEAFEWQADVSSEAQVMAMFAAIDQRYGRLDGLVNNAGVIARHSRLAQFSAERMQRVFSINVLGSFLCAREAVRRMSRAAGGQGGAIVNLSSAAARLGAANEYVDYAASKAAIDTMTMGLAREVGGEGIRVNAVRPGLIDTDIHASGGQPDRIARLGSQIPLGRGGTSLEVAEAIVWLLSPQAAYVNGALLDVTGGR